MNKSYIEAEKHLKEGDSALKTGLFKWNKDYASAAMHYDEAAKLFRACKDYDSAIKALEKVIEVNEKLNDAWAVARNYETIILINLERTDGKTLKAEVLVNKTLKAGYYFRLADSYNNYITLVKKVAKYLEESQHTTEALNLYKTLLNDLEEGEQYYLRAEVVSSYLGVLVTLEKYEECINILERELNIRKKGDFGKANLDTMVLTIIGLHLIVDKVEEAEKKLEIFATEVKDFIKSPEFDCCEKMIQAYIEGNQEAFNKQTQRSLVNNIFPLNIIKVLRKLTVKPHPDRKPQALEDIIGTREGDAIVVKEEDRKKVLDSMFC